MKCCIKCGLTKPEDDFPWRSPNGVRRNQCRTCDNAYKRNYYGVLNKDKTARTARAYRLKNREQFRESSRRYYQTHKEQVLAKNRRNASANLERNRERIKKYYWKNRDLIGKQKRARYAARIEHNRKYARDWYKSNYVQILSRKRANPHYRIKTNIASRIAAALVRQSGMKAGRTVELIGCSMPDLRLYLESRFGDNMTWQNYGTYWHIDHIIPCALFDLTKPSHQRRCFHFSNMQPMEAAENIRKSDTAPPVHQFKLL